MREIVQRDVSLEWCPLNDLLLSVIHATVDCAMTYIGEMIAQPSCTLSAVMIVVVTAIVAAELFDIIMNSFDADAFQ